MFCPVCGKKQASDLIRFCSGCGFSLTGVAEVVAAGGASVRHLVKTSNKIDSPRKKGIKQGAMLMIVGCLLVLPVVAILIPAFGLSPYVIPITAILSFMGGLMRIIYAAMFESPISQDSFVESADFAMPGQLNASFARGSLPPQSSVPVSELEPAGPGRWKETADLVTNPVTETTTKLLEKEIKD